MRVLIVAKTRRGPGACVGGITWEGRSVRLLAAGTGGDERAGLQYGVGEVWEIDFSPDPHIVAPHRENVIVHSARRLGRADDPVAFIQERMPPVSGPPDQLFEGRLQTTPAGALYIAERSGLPSCSTSFWRPDQPLQMDCEGKRIRYRYPSPAGGRTLTFVGYQEPLATIPAGAVLRISLAHWWRPKEKPEEELRCYAQLSGWFLDHSPDLTGGKVVVAGMPVPAGASSPPSPLPLAAGRLEEAQDTLRQTFGFHHFLPLQKEIISRALQAQDTVVIMPTGGGKSLCYQLPALLFDGLTVVISPLIALMQDQVSQLRQLDVPAAFLNSTLSHSQYVSVTARVRQGDTPILYVAPETLLRPETLLLLEQSRLACLAVDEAHCISEWGHDFRPEYRQLQEVRRRFPRAVCLALTATATPRVRADIGRLLGIPESGHFVASFNRPNLVLSAQPRRGGLGQTLEFLEQHRDQAGIIYCATRQQVDELAAELAGRGWPTRPYHAGLDDSVRRQNQEWFIREDAGIMVATVAFGMGINKSNVRFVLHYHLPKDLESYYQEIGRAGRDGLPAHCLLLHSRADAITIRHFIEEGAPSERPGRQARLEAILRYAETAGCRRLPLLTYFGEQPAERCGQCDQCLTTQQPAPQTDVTIAAQKFLSCVKRTGELFGPAHLIDVLRGSRSKKVLERGHDRLSTYGIGAEFSAHDWRELARQFITQGLVEQDLQYGSLRLTPKGRQVFKGEKVFATLTPSAAPAAAPAAAPDRVQTDYDRALFQELRTLRRQLADQAGVPSYIVFSDRALAEMAAFYPQTEAEFLAINGVGRAKLASYGEAFLRVIRLYLTNRPGR